MMMNIINQHADLVVDVDVDVYVDGEDIDIF